jgi:hypothetical protein
MHAHAAVLTSHPIASPLTQFQAAREEREEVRLQRAVERAADRAARGLPDIGSTKRRRSPLETEAAAAAKSITDVAMAAAAATVAAKEARLARRRVWKRRRVTFDIERRRRIAANAVRAERRLRLSRSLARANRNDGDGDGDGVGDGDGDGDGSSGSDTISDCVVSSDESELSSAASGNEWVYKGRLPGRLNHTLALLSIITCLAFASKHSLTLYSFLLDIAPCHSLFIPSFLTLPGTKHSLTLYSFLPFFLPLPGDWVGGGGATVAVVDVKGIEWWQRFPADAWKPRYAELVWQPLPHGSVQSRMSLLSIILFLCFPNTHSCIPSLRFVARYGSDTDSDTSSSDDEAEAAAAAAAAQIHVDADGYADVGFRGEAWVKAPE